MEKNNDLELMKQMAMADGVLTENEKSVFRNALSLTDEELQKLFEEIETELESVQSETEIIDWKKKNGLDFEKYIVNLLPDNYKNLRWTGDKYVNGRYDEQNLSPDIIFDIELAKTYSVAVECKFRMSYFKDYVFVAKKDQLERYRSFQEQNNIPVFIAIGVGGCGARPEDLYLVPVEVLNYHVTSKKYIQRYKKEVGKKLFYQVKYKRFR